MIVIWSLSYADAKTCLLYYFFYKTIWQADQRAICVMDISCNVTLLETQTGLNSTIYHQIKMVSMCVSCTVNTALCVPLLLVLKRSPSLLGHTRFLLLAHLLLCENLQVELHSSVFNCSSTPFYVCFLSTKVMKTCPF